MKFLPIVMRELSVSARRPFLHYARVLVGVMGFGAALFIFNFGSAESEMKGRTLLTTLGIIALVIALLAGVFLTADCISEEKREGTLGLLFLTDLRGVDVVLGKLVAQSATAFTATWSLLPILALPLMTGGVTLEVTLRVMLSLTLTLLLSLSVGLAVSSACQNSRKAALGTLSIVLSLAGIPMVFGFLWHEFARTELPLGLLAFSPIYTLIASYAPNFTGLPSCYWSSVIVLTIQSILFLVWASILTRSSWQQAGQQPVVQKSGFRAAVSGRRRRLALPLIQERLYEWLCRRQPPGIGFRLFLGVLSLFCFVMLLVSVTTQHNEAGFLASVYTAVLIHLVMKLDFALESTRQLHEDARQGGLELLLVTPLTEEHILRGHMLALSRRFRGALAFLTWMNLTLLLATLIFHKPLKMEGEIVSLFAIYLLCGIVVLYFDFRAIAWMGAWRALRSETHLRASLSTLTGILGVPWLIGAVLASMTLPGRSQVGEVIGVSVLWFTGCIILSFLLGFRARRRVLKKFREAACAHG